MSGFGGFGRFGGFGGLSGLGGRCTGRRLCRVGRFGRLGKVGRPDHFGRLGRGPALAKGGPLQLPPRFAPHMQLPPFQAHRAQVHPLLQGTQLLDLHRQALPGGHGCASGMQQRHVVQRSRAGDAYLPCRPCRPCRCSARSLCGLRAHGQLGAELPLLRPHGKIRRHPRPQRSQRQIGHAQPCLHPGRLAKRPGLSLQADGRAIQAHRQSGLHGLLGIFSPVAPPGQRQLQIGDLVTLSEQGIFQDQATAPQSPLAQGQRQARAGLLGRSRRRLEPAPQVVHTPGTRSGARHVHLQALDLKLRHHRRLLPQGPGIDRGRQALQPQQGHGLWAGLGGRAGG